MQALDQLVHDARALAGGTPALNPAEAEVSRQMQICNACRYCEGFCAVFPAMTRRLEFGKADVHFLANLCHNCGGCLHACQYAPPHEFAINVPRAMAQVRLKTYGDYAWPAALGTLYRRNGLTLSLALALGLVLILVLILAVSGTLWGAQPGGEFYRLMPHHLMVGLFAPVLLFAVAALALGVRRFLADITPATSGAPASAPAAREATGDVLKLTYLEGGHGQGCNEADDAFSLARRRVHHLTFYGFLLCFAATASGTVLHYLGMPAPYDLPSLPKLLGGTGGVMMMLGTVGLFRLNLQRHPLHGDPAQRPMDLGFTALLLLTSASGMAVWGARDTAAMPLLLAVHLGSVMALFLTMPYGKFAHGIYRSAALLRHAVERRQPDRLGLGGE